MHIFPDGKNNLGIVHTSSKGGKAILITEPTGPNLRQSLTEVCQDFDVNYSVDEDTSEFYAEILNNLREIGRPVPTNDIWIASVALQHGLKLFSKDQHFKYVPGLVMVP